VTVPQEPFNLLALRTGNGKSDSGFLQTEDGRTIEGTYEFSLIPEGVVSLKGAKDAISSVSCLNDGSIRIVLKTDYMAGLGSLEEMYPIGSVLSVDAVTFGECKLSDSDIDGSVILPTTSSGYLRVHSISGSIQDHIVTGQVVEYLDMFEKAVFDLRNIGDSESETTRTSSRLSLDDNDDDITLQTSERFTAEETIERKLWPKNGEPSDAEVTTKTTLFVTSTLSKSVVKKSRNTNSHDFVWGSEIGLKGEIAFSLNSEVIGWEPDAMVLAGLTLPIPSFGLVVRTVVFSWDKLIEFESYALGFVVDFPLILRPKITLKTGWKIPFEFGMSTGRKNIQASIVTTDGNFESWSVNTLPGTDASAEFKRPDIANIFVPDEEFVFSVFFGLQPTLKLAVPGFSFGLGSEIGAQAEAKARLITPYNPVSEDDVLFRSNTTCDFCHNVQVTVDGVIGNLKAITEVGDNRYEKEIPPVIKQTYKIAAYCFLPNVLFNVCGSGCCNIAFNCDSENICRIESPPTPTPTSTPSPIDEPIVSPFPVDPFVEESCAARPFLQVGSGFPSNGATQEETDHVKGLQILLNFKLDALSANPIDTDGLFGTGTAGAVTSFQNEQGLDADGLVGSNTWNALCEPPLPTV